MSWDAFQREMLTALGHTLYVPVDATATRVEDELVDVRAAKGRVQEPGAFGSRNTETDMRPRNAASPEALMYALLRAANLDKDDAAILQSRLPPLNALTGNSGAKRKLWPTLRAMRARRRT